MLTLTPIGAVMAGAVLAALIVAGAGALFAGLNAMRRARRMAGEMERQRAMLGAAPMHTLLIRSDGRLETSMRVADMLGLAAIPATLESLLSQVVFEVGAGERLGKVLEAARRGGRAFSVPIRVAGSSRHLFLHGDRAPADLNAPGGVLVWIFDATELQAEVERLDHEVSALRIAFDSLSELIEVAPMPMWYRGRDLRLAMVNSAYVRAVEARDAAEVVSRQIELVEAQGQSGPIASAADARDSGKAQTTTLPATIGGARRTLRFHDIPVPSGGTAGFAIDIEELEQTRAGMKRFTDAQRSMLDRMSAGVAQFSADRALVFCNQPFRSLFAMRPEWLADRPEFDRVLERMREAKRLPEVRDFPAWKAERRQWFTMADTAAEESWHLPGSIHLRVVAQAMPEGGLLLIFEDRTEQVQLASARDTLLRVRAAMFDNLFEALGVFASDGRLQIWNSKFRQLWGLEEAVLDAHPRVDALARAVAGKLARPARADLIPELVRSATVERQQRGGTLALADGRHFNMGAVPLPDGNALLTLLDVSDSRRIESALRERNEALEAADQVKTAFVANMSYELRTPLTSIKGFAELMAGGYAGELPESAAGYVDAILESAARLSALVDDVLDLTANAGAGVNRAPVALDGVARAAAQALAPMAVERRIDLAVEIDPSAGTINAEGERIGQAIEHMLRHAISGTPAGGRVLLYLDGTAKAARIIVSDNGPGMDEGAVRRAFDRFVPGARTRSGERPLGLGLPLAKQFVEAHGGTLTLVSEPGQGTMLTAELPRG